MVVSALEIDTLSVNGTEPSSAFIAASVLVRYVPVGLFYPFLVPFVGAVGRAALLLGSDAPASALAVADFALDGSLLACAVIDAAPTRGVVRLVSAAGPSLVMHVVLLTLFMN